MGEAWGPCNKQYCFGNGGAFDRGILSLVFRVFKGLTRFSLGRVTKDMGNVDRYFPRPSFLSNKANKTEYE